MATSTKRTRRSAKPADTTPKEETQVQDPTPEPEVTSNESAQDSEKETNEPKDTSGDTAAAEEDQVSDQSEATAEETPVTEAPTEDAPTEDDSTEDDSTKDAPTDQAPADNAPAEEEVTNDAPVQEDNVPAPDEAPMDEVTEEAPKPKPLSLAERVAAKQGVNLDNVPKSVFVINILDEYARAMRPNASIDMAQAGGYQSRLYMVYNTAINAGSDSAVLLDILVAYFKENQNAAFGASRIMQRLDQARLSELDKMRFMKLSALFSMIARSGKQRATKGMDLEALAITLTPKFAVSSLITWVNH